MFRNIYRTASRSAASFFSSKLNIFKAIYPEAAVAFTTTLALFFVLHTAISIAAPPPTPFEPGETLDPGCAPGEENCFVSETPDLSDVDSDDLEEGEANLYFTPERVSNHIDVLANTAARHAAVTLSGSNYLTLTGQEITAGTIDISDHTNLSVGSGLLLTDDSLSVTGLTTSHFASSNISQWANDSGFISSYTEIDPIFTASDVSGVVAGDIANWNTAFGWGDHSAAGYFSLNNRPRLSALSADTFSTTEFYAADSTFTNSNDPQIRAYGIGTDPYEVEYIKFASTAEDENLTIWRTNSSYSPIETIVLDLHPDTSVLEGGREYQEWNNLEWEVIPGEYYLIEFERAGSRTMMVNTVEGGLDFDLGPLHVEAQGQSNVIDARAYDFTLGRNNGVPKGVVGSLDPADLPDYANAVVGEVLTRTANGAEFTTLTTGNFATPNISQWTNDSGFITDLSTFDANDLSILDAGGYFTATTVEDALAELFVADASAFSPLNKPRLSDLEGDVMTYGGFDSYTSIETDEYTSSGQNNDSGMQWHILADEDFLLEEVTVVANKYGNTDPDLQLLIYESVDEVAPLTTDTLLVDQTRDLFVEDNQTTPTTFVLDEPLQMVAGTYYVIYVRIQESDYSFFKGYRTGTTSVQEDMGPVTILKSYRTRYNQSLTDSGSFYLELQNGFEPKGVVGPLDPDDLANYTDASTNTFLRKTDNGLEFTDFPGDLKLILSAPPIGTNVNAGSLYINPAGLSESEPVAWTRKGVWDFPDVGSDVGPALGDLDGDGDLDAMVGEYDSGISYAYVNTGTASSPIWSTKPEWNAPSVAERAKPVFADIDNDGDLDLFIGGRNDADTPASNVYAFENTNDSSSPVWVSKPEWTAATGQSPDPTLADIDNDGDLDLLVGSFVIEMEVYRNTGSDEEPIWTRDSSLDIDDGRYNGSPNLVDVDNDGDLDVIISTKGGTCTGDVRGYENEGTAFAPNWIRNTDWDLADAFSCYVSAGLGDVDGDNDADLFVGTGAGNTVAYENTGSAFGTENNTLFGVAVNGNEKFRINGTGNVYATGDMHATGFINTSTEELKENITFLSADRERNILNDIRTLDIANYRYITDEAGEPLRLGLIAERSPSEILSSDGKGVDLYKLSTFTLAGLKSLTEKVDSLESTLLLDGVVLDGVGEEKIKPQNPFVAALKKVGLTIRDGILSIKKLITGEVKTDKLCVGDTCVTETEFLEILQNTNVEPHSEETPTNEPESGEEDPAQEEPEETPEPEQENETSTPDPEEGATPEPGPVIESGTVSDETDPLQEGNEEEEGEDAEAQDEGSTPEEGEAGGDVL